MAAHKEPKHVNPRIPAPTRVLCVDDNADMTAVLRIMIDAQPTMECAGCLDSADDLVAKVRRVSPPPHVVLLDATMPGQDPLLAMTELSREIPGIKTIIYSGHDDPEFIDRAMSAGAWGCISKRDDPDTVLRAVREVAAGRVYWPGPRHKS